MQRPNLKAVISALAISISTIVLTATTTVACEISRKTWPNLIVSLLDPDAEQFWLQLPNTSDATIIVSLVDKAYDKSSSRAEKKVRVAAGHPIKYEIARDTKRNVSALMFQSTKGAFDGASHLTQNDRVTRTHFIVVNPNGQNILIATKYGDPRPIADALDDTVCAFNLIPSMLDENS